MKERAKSSVTTTEAILTTIVVGCQQKSDAMGSRVAIFMAVVSVDVRLE
jgi:hypothetical protein